MTIRWNQIAVAVAAGFLMGAFFSDFYHMHIKRRPPQPATAEGAIERITHELELSAPQQEKVSVVFEKYRPEVKKVKDSINPKLEDLRLRIKAELKEILTPEQYARMEKLDNNSKLRREPPPDKGGGDPRPRPEERDRN